MTIDTPAATSFLAPTAETLIELVAIALESQRGGGQGFVITQSGELAFRSEGKELLIARSEELLEAANVPHEHVAQLLNADPALLLTLADAAEIVSFAELGVEFQAGFIAAHGQPVGQYEGLAGLSDETLRDGLFSNQLNNDGTLIEALGGVNGASIYFSVSLELKTFANLFGRVNAGVGVDLYHLPPLPDEDYIRGMDPTIFPVIEEGGGISAEEPTTVPDVFTVSEDTPLAGDLAANDSVPNPGAIFALSGPPPANGTFVLNPNGTFTFDPDPDFSGEVTFTYTLTDPASGTVRTSVVVIDVIAVADAPIVTAANTVTDEDIPVPLAGLTVALDDTDGSETIAVTISGVPTGATLSVGTEIAPGVWSISPADLATVELTPPADFHGVIDLVIEATATEGSNGNTSTTSVPFTVTVEAEADLPNLTPGTSATSEDQPAPVGQSIAVGVTDTDGSEAITDVSVTNAPAGAVVDWTVTGAAVVTAVPGGFSITGPESDIIATLATLTVLPPQNSDDDFILDIATTATDADGSTSTNTGQHPVTVEAVADVPSAIVAPATGNEDMPIPLVGLGGTLADTDGSEVQTFSISNIPAGATLSAGTVQPDGSVLLTSAELAGLTITPPLHFSGTFPLTLTSIATETSNGSSEQISDTFNVTVTAVADAPVVTGGSSSVDEDVTTVFGADISYALVDMDGSEVVSQVAVTGITAGADITFTAAGGATVTAVAGGYTITGPEADIRATLDTFAYDPADDDDTNVQLTVEVTTTDDGGSTASATDTHDLIVAAVADAPSGSGVGAGNEDTAIAVPVTTQLNDTDGSETITQAVVTAPTGVVLGGFGPSGATVVQAGQDWTITGTPAQIDAALAAMTATPPNNSDADFNLLVTLTATETSPVGGEVTTATADTTFAVPVTVTAVADAPNVVVPVAPIPTEEDTAVAVGAALGGSLNDTDGSETISY
ncbi:Ig-like domain-containing protein, partial [Ahrensia sp. R2A130]|uniref:Ig-like domain-containing protein n=1 Tax=Ahrensia sp. R2A130 TaxID=744979 RepID=UPI0001E0BCDC